MQQPILSAEEIEIVFTNIHPILKLNTELLEEFQLRLDIWDYRKTIGDILINFAPKLEAYTEYCNHYENAIAVVEKAKKRAAFSSYLEVLTFPPPLPFPSFFFLSKETSCTILALFYSTPLFPFSPFPFSHYPIGIGDDLILKEISLASQ